MFSPTVTKDIVGLYPWLCPNSPYILINKIIIVIQPYEAIGATVGKAHATHGMAFTQRYQNITVKI